MDINKTSTASEQDELIQLGMQLQIKQLQVSSLLEVTQAINNNLSSDKLFRIYEFILRAQIAVRKLAVFIKDEEFYCICKYGLDENQDEQELLDELLKYNRLTFLEENTDPPLEGFDILIPVFHKERPLAYALLATPELNQFETLDEKIKFIQTITNIIVVAIENKRLFNKQLEQEKMQRELELAAKVQSMLVPKNLPDHDKLEMAAIYLPHADIGGDYYDYIKLNEKEVLFCIADVSGKGISAAILMANFQAMMRALAKTVEEFDEFILSLNETVTEITGGERFITFFVGKYHIETRHLSYINAGHNPPVLLCDNKIELLEDGCTILGMFEEIPHIKTGSIHVGEDALLVNYTDGLTDLENEEGKCFTLERLYGFMRLNKDLPMKALNDKLLDEIMRFKGKNVFIDDVSVLSCKFR